MQKLREYRISSFWQSSVSVSQLASGNFIIYRVSGCRYLLFSLPDTTELKKYVDNFGLEVYIYTVNSSAPLAQWIKASDYGSEDWGFDSLRAHQ